MQSWTWRRSGLPSVSIIWFLYPEILYHTNKKSLTDQVSRTHGVSPEWWPLNFFFFLFPNYIIVEETVQLLENTCSTISLSIDGWTSSNDIPSLGVNGKWAGPDFKIHKICIDFVAKQRPFGYIGHTTPENER
jgi:hypothetical protein